MYVVMGYTRGDSLIQSVSVPLFASASRDECETKMAEITQERDDWLAKHEVPALQQCSIYSRFAIIKTKFGAS